MIELDSLHSMEATFQIGWPNFPNRFSLKPLHKWHFLPLNLISLPCCWFMASETQAPSSGFSNDLTHMLPTRQPQYFWQLCQTQVFFILTWQGQSPHAAPHYLLGLVSLLQVILIVHTPTTHNWFTSLVTGYWLVVICLCLAWDFSFLPDNICYSLYFSDVFLFVCVLGWFCLHPLLNG